MIRWLWSNLLKWGWDFNRERRDGHDVVRRNHATLGRPVPTDSYDDGDTRLNLTDPIKFKVQAVNGGTLIETSYYDQKKDQARVKLYIITPEENLSESIGKIVTMELLQK